MAVPGPGRDSGEWRGETGGVIARVTGVTQQQEMLPVSPPAHLTDRLQLLPFMLRLGRHHQLVTRLRGVESVAVEDPRKL